MRSSFNLTSELRGSVGIASRYDRARSKLLFDSASSISEESYRGFVNFEWKPLEPLVFNGGLINEKNAIDSSNLSYRFATNYHVKHNHMFRLAYSKSLRAPTFAESSQQTIIRYDPDLILDAIIISDDQLEPEKLRNIELGYTWRTQNNAFNLDIKLFSEELDNIIDTRRDEFVDEFDPRNRVGTRTNSMFLDAEGAEIEFNYRPDEKLLIRGAYTHLRLEGLRHRATFPVTNISGLENSSPKNSSSLLLNYQFDNGFEVSAAVYHQSEAMFLRGNALDSYTRVDLKTAKTWSFYQSELELSFIAQNVGDDYQEFFETNVFETKYIFELKLKIP